MSPSWYELAHVRQVLVIRVHLEHIDNRNAAAVKELFDWLIAAHRRVILNLAEVEYIDSTILAKLLGLHKKITAAGGSLMLCGLQPQVREDFATLRFDQFFTIFDGEEQAVGGG